MKMDDFKLMSLLFIKQNTNKKCLMLHKRYQTELIQVIDKKINELKNLIEILPEWNFEKNINYRVKKMKLKKFVVYDSKTEAYGVPFYRDFTANALREWSEVATKKSEQNQISKFPADFTLFEVAEYDQLTGNERQYDVKFSHGTALEHVKPELATV